MIPTTLITGVTTYLFLGSLCVFALSAGAMLVYLYLLQALALAVVTMPVMAALAAAALFCTVRNNQ